MKEKISQNKEHTNIDERDHNEIKNIQKINTTTKKVSQKINGTIQSNAHLTEDKEKLTPQKTNYLTGATSGLSKIIGEKIKANGGDYFPIGSRNPQKLAHIAEKANKKGDFVSGDLFAPHSDAYDYCMNEVPESRGAFYFLSAIDMDKIPTGPFPTQIDPRTMDRWDPSISEEEKAQVREYFLNLFTKKLPENPSPDAIDPRTGKPWTYPDKDTNPISMMPWDKNISEEKRRQIQEEVLDDFEPNEKLIVRDDLLKKENINEKEKEQKHIIDNYKESVREKMSDQQISFFIEFIDRLLARESNEPLTVIFPNSILAKSYELANVKKASPYARMKNEMTKYIENNMAALKKKNVFIKNVTIGITGTDMFLGRGPISAYNSARLSRLVGGRIPVNQVPIRASDALDAEKVSSILYELGQEPPEETPDRIELFMPEHQDFGPQRKEKAQKRAHLAQKVDTFLNGDTKTPWNQDVKSFLRSLREEALQEYLRQEPDEKNALNIGMKNADIILNEYDNFLEDIEREDLIDIAERLEGNYP